MVNKREKENLLSKSGKKKFAFSHHHNFPSGRQGEQKEQRGTFVFMGKWHRESRHKTILKRQIVKQREKKENLTQFFIWGQQNNATNTNNNFMARKKLGNCINYEKLSTTKSLQKRPEWLATSQQQTSFDNFRRWKINFRANSKEMHPTQYNTNMMRISELLLCHKNKIVYK